jgi:plastocyanin
MGRKVPLKAVVALIVAMVATAGLLPVTSKGKPREIVLVAREMAFYAETDPKTPNPVIDVKARETVRIVLRNRDRGMTHDFAVPAVEAATEELDWNEEDDLIFDAPDSPGSYEYVCRPHLLMMKGTLRVHR